MGSGGVVVMDDATCMVDTARFFTDFSVEESCGKCVPCREGLKVMFDKLTDIVEGRGQEGDVEFLIEAGAPHQRHVSLRSWEERGKPGSFDDPVFQRRVRRPHPRQTLPCPGVPESHRFRGHGGQVQDVRHVLQELPIRSDYMGKEEGGPDRYGKMHQMPNLHHQLQIRRDQITTGSEQSGHFSHELQ